MVEILHSTCPHDCPSTCSLEVEKLSETEIGRVHGAKGNDYTAGVVCAKVARYAERIHHPDRLTKPLRRVGAKGVGIEAFEEISWDEALDEIAAKFESIKAEFGSEAIWPYHFAGTMGLVMRDGLDRFRHAYRTSRQLSTICTFLPDAGWNAGHGVKHGIDPREISDSDLIVVWGGNPVSTQVNVMTHIAKARKSRGAKLVVIDVYRTPTVEAADHAYIIRPGTDGALATALMHICFRDGYADRDYMAKFADVPDELEAHVRDKTPQWAAQITGLSVAEIEELAALYGKTERAFIRVGYGFARSRNGAVNMHAVTCLPVVTGKWPTKGAGALYGNAGMYPIDWTLVMGLDVRDVTIRQLDMCRLGPILLGDATDLQGGPPVKALFVQNTNPAVVCPDQNKVHAGLMRDDLFTVVHEQFMTETAEFADIVLPATMFLEHHDMYTGGGHVYFSVTKPVVRAPGECRTNHEVLCALAERLGLDHPGFKMSAWEIIEETVKRSGFPDAETLWENHWHDCVLSEDEMHFRNGFGHADGKFRFKPDWAAAGPYFEGMPSLPGYYTNIDLATDEHPFRMVAAPARNYLNSSFTETPTSKKREGRPTIKLHPDDLTALGIADGAVVRVGNRLGEIELHAVAFEGLQRGVVVVESVWPNKAHRKGKGVNALISAEPGQPKGGGVFHDTAVWVRAA
jgi:anaerobic selenocysteine-containing dehydrogenase